jgi:hypothetical protein
MNNKISIRQQEIIDSNKREEFLKKKLSTFKDRTQINSISFVKEDGRKCVQNVNPQFLIGENGKPKSINELAKDINAISHDLKAKFILL